MRKRKCLILSIYPAPYRVEVMDMFRNEFDISVFFETGSGDSRVTEWFKDGDYYTLDTAEGGFQFKNMTDDLKSFDLVLLYDYSTPTALKLILKCILLRIPYVINADGVMLTRHGNIIKDLIKSIAISNAAGCLASGNRAKDYFMKYGAKDKNIYLHTFSTLHANDIEKSPVDLETKNMIREELAIDKSKFVAIAVGRFIPLKRYSELIRAWKVMPDNYLLLLVGGGEEENSYRKIIDELHINNIQIEGFHPKDELKRFYMAADVFVHPTSYDVWGLVVNEAMSVGLPVIASDRCVAGLELIKTGKNGFIVPMGNDMDMCSKVEILYHNEKLYNDMRVMSLQTICNYTMENMASVQIGAFKEILKIENYTH